MIEKLIKQKNINKTLELCTGMRILCGFSDVK